MEMLNTAEIRLVQEVLGRELENLRGLVLSIEHLEKNGPVEKKVKDAQLKALYNIRTGQDVMYKLEKEDLAK